MSVALRYIRDMDKRTGLKIEEWLGNARWWQETQAPLVDAWYTTNNTAYPSEAIATLKRILNRADELRQLFVSERVNRTHRINDLDIIVLVEDTELNLRSMEVYSKFIRSARDEHPGQVEPPYELVLGENVSLESVARDLVGDSEWKETWVRIGINNNLRETDYGEGFTPLLVLPRRGNASFTSSIIGSLKEPIAIFGRDITYDFLIDDDGDLVALNEGETLVQSFHILSTLRIGANPNYPELGFRLVTSNLYSDWIQLGRGLASNFFTDDAFEEVKIVNLHQEDDAIRLTLLITTSDGAEHTNDIFVNKSRKPFDNA